MAIILFGLDAFVLNQGIIALITLIIVLPVKIIKALINRKNTLLFKKQLRSCGVYLLMVILIVSSNSMNNKIARNRAQVLIAACEKFKYTNNEYPKRLTDLIPKFIDKIPVAKYTFISNRFFYISSKESHLLSYTVVPPFRRSIYNFTSKKWAFID
ncbi:MAG: hypothetical protein HOA61_14625 [Bacteroidetes bacterium]|nr:hypothetical protein [Bacteroidota bacterium]